MFTSAEWSNIDFNIAIGAVAGRSRVRFHLPWAECSDQKLSETLSVDLDCAGSQKFGLRDEGQSLARAPVLIFRKTRGKGHMDQRKSPADCERRSDAQFCKS